ncbi:MAG: hypothetical protein R2762_24760 [Bryobacteraceae bacterium]
MPTRFEIVIHGTVDVASHWHPAGLTLMGNVFDASPPATAVAVPGEMVVVQPMTPACETPERAAPGHAEQRGAPRRSVLRQPPLHHSIAAAGDSRACSSWNHAGAPPTVHAHPLLIGVGCTSKLSRPPVNANSPLCADRVACRGGRRVEVQLEDRDIEVSHRIDRIRSEHPGRVRGQGEGEPPLAEHGMVVELSAEGIPRRVEKSGLGSMAEADAFRRSR